MSFLQDVLEAPARNCGVCGRFVPKTATYVGAEYARRWNDQPPGWRCRTPDGRDKHLWERVTRTEDDVITVEILEEPGSDEMAAATEELEKAGATFHPESGCWQIAEDALLRVANFTEGRMIILHINQEGFGFEWQGPDATYRIKVASPYRRES